MICIRSSIDVMIRYINSFFISKEVLTIYERMLSESMRLERRIEDVQEHLEKLPEGNLLCTQNGNRYKWYLSNGANPVYLPKKQRDLAEQLAVKKYYVLLQKELLEEQDAVQSYLMKHPQSKGLESQKLFEHAEFRRLLSSHFQPVEQELLDWQAAPYEQNPKHPEQLLHKCKSGHVVRSKSEAMIDTFLYLNKIPFRYECALQLENITCYPDFTIRHPRTGSVYLWEHFGLMDNPDYARSFCSKMQLYVSHGIIPSIQLITTYETKDNPLTVETIENTIQQYFL